MTLMGQSQCHSDLEALYLVKQQSYAICIYRESIGAVTPDLSDLEIQCQGNSDFKSLYLIKEPS